MPNIYLRLPYSRCQFYRNRTLDSPLAPQDPVKFSEYSEELFVIKNSLYNKALSGNIDERCFSHFEWNNMMNGRKPSGGKKMLGRDKAQWLSYEEINTLNGNMLSHKTSKYDYLCIKLPHEVFCEGSIKPVTPTWTLDSCGVDQLVTLINNSFKRTVVEWALSTFDYCTDNNEIILRSQASMLERFLMRYGIDATMEEKNNIRRVIDRWLKAENNNFDSYSCLDMRFCDSKEKRLRIKQVEIL